MTSITLLAGSTAKVVGLKAKPELNGESATIKSFNADKGRYNVEVSTSILALKGDNLEQADDQRLPPAKAIEDWDYPLHDVLLALDIIDASVEYRADVAVPHLRALAPMGGFLMVFAASSCFCFVFPLVSRLASYRFLPLLPLQPTALLTISGIVHRAV